MIANIIQNPNPNPNPIHCIPGDCLMKCEESVSGLNGTYSRNGYIYASIAGAVRLVQLNDNTKTIEVVSRHQNKHLVPRMGSIVTCRVLSITTNVVRLNIHCISGQVLKQPFRALLRKEEIRDYEKEKIQIWKCFRPSDIILAKVIGFGDNHNFLVTTAHNELGVVVALNPSGIPMKPISWTEMSCPTTYTTENRKVAQLATDGTDIQID